METSPSTVPPPSRLLTGLPRLLAVSVGLPVVICLLDQLAIEASSSVPALRWLMPLLFVLQVGLLAAVIGRFLDSVLLRCVVFTWAIVMVDTVALTTIYFGAVAGLRCMLFALLSGQFGLLAIWGILSRAPWPVRLPLFLSGILFVIFIMMQTAESSPWHRDSRMWASILAIQSAVVVILCTLMRWRGYRLLRVHGDEQADLPLADRESFQFEIKHILLWTTIVTPLLIVSQSTDWLLLEFQEVGWAMVVAFPMAVVCWVTMFAALGAGRLLTRMLALCLTPPLLGLLLKLLTAQWSLTWGRSRSVWLFFDLQRLGYGWILWMVLAAWFLAALLLVFRTAGYRIQRVPARAAA